MENPWCWWNEREEALEAKAWKLAEVLEHGFTTQVKEEEEEEEGQLEEVNI